MIYKLLDDISFVS